MDSKGQKAGKGPLIAEEISNTLGTSQDQYLFQLVDKFVLDDQGGSFIRWRWDGKSPCLRAQMEGHTPVVLESHPNDSRVKIDDSGSIQTLTSRMGTGGGNVPMVMMPFSKSRRAKSSIDFETWKSSEVSNTINTFDQGDVRATDVVVMATQRPNAEIMVNKCPTITASAGLGGTWKPVVCIQGNVIDRSDNAGANGAGWRMDKCYTLNTIDRPAVVYPKKTGPLMANSHPGSYSGQDAYQDMLLVEKCYSLDEKMGQTYVHEDMANTLAQRDYKQPQTVVYPKKTVGSLMASAYNKLGTQEAMNDMFVVCEKGVPKTISMEVFHCYSAEERTAALKARDYKDPQIIALDRAALNQGKNAKYDISIDGGGTAQTLVARGPGAVCYRKPLRYGLQVGATATSDGGKINRGKTRE